MDWIEHVKSYQRQHKCTYKDALRLAKSSYQTGGSIKSGYIKRLIAEHKFDLAKIVNPSKHLLSKYGNKPQTIEEVPYDNIETIEQPIEIEKPIEVQYDDFHVEDFRNFKKAKKTRNKLTKAEKDKLAKEEAEQKKRKEDEEIKRARLKELNDLLGKVGKYMDTERTIENEYQKELKAIRSKKGIRTVKRDQLIEELVDKTNKQTAELKRQNTEVHKYMKANKINDLNTTYGKIRQTIQKIR